MYNCGKMATGTSYQFRGDITLAVAVSIINGLFLFTTTPARGELSHVDDNMWLRINWQQPVDILPSDKEILSVTSNGEEKYKCVLPSTDKSDQDADDKVVSQSVGSIIKKLHEQSSCSYRMEQYWTYELCHGKHLRQYHEEKEMGQKTKLQEYYLGRYDDTKNTLEDREESSEKTGIELPTKRIEDRNVPYYEVLYTDGTYCDLISTPRSTRVYYVCHEQGRNEIYSQEETSSCEYQVTILTHLLCQHPAYRPVENTVTDIMCYAQDGSPRQPHSLTQLTAPAYGPGSQAGNVPPLVRGVAAQQVELGDDDEDDDDDDAEDEEEVTVTIHADGTTTATTTRHSPGTGTGTGTARRLAQPVLVDRALMTHFLQGKHCLQGGKGYWKHEICYGRYVQQYHEEMSKIGKKTKGATVNLGYWNVNKHKALLVEKDKRYKENVKQRALQLYMKHQYVDGDVCDVTGKPRSVEVKLKCIKATNVNQVAIYLAEPKTCEYTMVVESPIICQLLEHIDDYGVPQINPDEL